MGGWMDEQMEGMGRRCVLEDRWHGWIEGWWTDEWVHGWVAGWDNYMHVLTDPYLSNISLVIALLRGLGELNACSNLDIFFLRLCVIRQIHKAKWDQTDIQSIEISMLGPNHRRQLLKLKAILSCNHLCSRYETCVKKPRCFLSAQ